MHHNQVSSGSSGCVVESLPTVALDRFVVSTGGQPFQMVRVNFPMRVSVILSLVLMRT